MALCSTYVKINKKYKSFGLFPERDKFSKMLLQSVDRLVTETKHTTQEYSISLIVKLPIPVS